MRKICVVITARPSYSRVKSALRAIQSSQKLELEIILTASSVLELYGDVKRVIAEDGFTISDSINTTVMGNEPEAMCKTTGLAIIQLSEVFRKMKPSAVLTIADRFETMATAIAASYQNIPLIHLQGGEITGSIDEKVRHSITKLADIHLVANKHARDRVIRMGENPNKVFDVGCPSIDLAKEVLATPAIGFDIVGKYGGTGANINTKFGYYVVLQHPVTTEFAESHTQISSTLKVIHDLKLPTFWIWPNLDAGSDGVSKEIRKFREKFNSSEIHFFRNIPPEDFLKVLYHSKGIIGNSSVGIRECSYLGVPCINIGSRQFGRDRGPNVIDVQPEYFDIKNAIELELPKISRSPSFIYGDGNAGTKIAQILETVELGFEKTLRFDWK